MKIALRIIALPFMFILQIIVMMKMAITSSILFLKHGGEWVTFEKNDKDTIRELLDRKRKSPLILAVMEAIMEQHTRYLYYKDLGIEDLLSLRNSNLWKYVEVYSHIKNEQILDELDVYHNPLTTINKEFKEGEKVRINSVFNDGDIIGITNNIDRENGYDLRVGIQHLTKWRIKIK